MSAQLQRPPASNLASSIGIGKDIFSLLRDASLFLLAVLLVAFPQAFNQMMVNAGFEEGSLVGFKWKSNLKKTTDELEATVAHNKVLKLQTDELLKALEEAKKKIKDPALILRIEKLEEEYGKLRNKTGEVQAAANQTINSNNALIKSSPNAKRTVAADAPSNYSVGLQTLGFSDEERIALNSKIQSQGFSLDETSWAYTERPSWFARNSTVFYYDDSTRRVATQLAQFLTTITGQTFTVQRGGGYGVDPSRQNVTLFVHYIRL
jgi:seryl-tRNA synthetase